MLKFFSRCNIIIEAIEKITSGIAQDGYGSGDIGEKTHHSKRTHPHQSRGHVSLTATSTSLLTITLKLTATLQHHVGSHLLRITHSLIERAFDMEYVIHQVVSTTGF